MTITIIIILSIVNNSEKNVTFKIVLYKIIPYFSVFIITFLLNNIFYALSMKLLKVEKVPYVESSIPWGKMPVKEILNTSVRNFYSVYMGKQFIFINKVTITLFILSFFMVFLIKRNKRWVLLLLICLFVSVNSSFLILGTIGPIRALTPYFPIALSFLAFFIYVNTKAFYVKNAFVLGIILIGMWQINLSSFFANQEALIFSDELHYSQELITQLNALGIKNIGKYKLAIYGEKSFPSSQQVVYGEVLGHGFYNWDTESPIGSTNRIANFLENNGYPTERITTEEYQKVLPKLKESAVFPEKDSIKISENIILIRIS